MRESTTLKSEKLSSAPLLFGETTPKIHNRKPELHLTLPTAMLHYADECLLLESTGSTSGTGSNGQQHRRDKSANQKNSSPSISSSSKNVYVLNRSGGKTPTPGTRRRFKHPQRNKPNASLLVPLGTLVMGFLIVILVRQRVPLSSFHETVDLHDRMATNITLEHVTATSTDRVQRRTASDRDKEEDKVVTASTIDDLDAFPSLHVALDSSDVVVLYFAAAWCPMSTPITTRLDDLFRERLMEVEERNEDPSLAIVYISSDKDASSFVSYIKPGWLYVPFANVDERSALKRHFRTCAKREMDEVGLETRDYEIPNVIVLSGATREVLTYEGIQDIKELGVEALTHWMDLNPSPSRTTTQT